MATTPQLTRGPAVRVTATGANPYLPAPARILRIRDVVPDVRLYDLRFQDRQLAAAFDWHPGQFVMLSILGVGEAPFSLPSSPTRPGTFQLAIRRAGCLTDYLFDHVREGAPASAPHFGHFTKASCSRVNWTVEAKMLCHEGGKKKGGRIGVYRLMTKESRSTSSL